VFQSPSVDIHPEVAAALMAGHAVVALESTLISHGLPWPVNLETARAAEASVRQEGAVPATIAICKGRPTIGLQGPNLEALARGVDVAKASRRDIAVAIAEGRTAGTTVAATMFLAHRAGIRLLATGGIGGAHRGSGEISWDISADLFELARTPVAVVCAGAKSILDVPRTLEILETYGVPVLSYGADDFPAFYLRSAGVRASARVDAPEQAAAVVKAHWGLGGAGVLLAQPLPEDLALEAAAFEDKLAQAEALAAQAGIHGSDLTPFLLARLAELTGNETVRANQALIVANARLASQVAAVLAPT
jgi:pseudouridine-5'-phosphate glycosidase